MGFTYWMPTKIMIDQEVVKKHSYEFTGYGNKALIVTGKSSAKKSGALEDVIQALEFNGIGYVIFDRIEENPATQTIEKAAQFGRSAGAEFIVGIGGGSPLDAAKAIGVMIKNPHLTEKTLFTDEKLMSIPILSVPTTSGTGSETTPYAILTDHSAQTKRKMTHLVEGYLNTNSNMMSEMLVCQGLALWGECTEKLLDRDFDFATREKLMLASTLAGMVIANTGTSLPHGMGYALTYSKGVPHGLANACLFTAYLNQFHNKEKIEKIYHLLGFDTQRKFDKFLSDSIHLDIVVNEEELQIWSHLMCSNQAKLKNHPEIVTYEDIYEIYQQSLKNYKV
ncbi:MAG: alcohol dehydrogenase [Clostridia bacterium]|nr:alcohol dehydrogenase [Clostridia bacterium]